MTAKEFQSFVLRDPEQAASVVDSLMNTEVRTTFFSEYLLQRCVRFHVEVATLGFVHEAACQMLEKQLKADPHRDKEKARNALDLKFCSQLIATFYDHHARDGRSLLQSSDIGRQLSLTNQTKRSLELLNRLRNAVEDSKWGSEPALFFKV